MNNKNDKKLDNQWKSNISYAELVKTGMLSREKDLEKPKEDLEILIDVLDIKSTKEKSLDTKDKEKSLGDTKDKEKSLGDTKDKEKSLDTKDKEKSLDTKDKEKSLGDTKDIKETKEKSPKSLPSKGFRRDFGSEFSFEDRKSNFGSFKSFNSKRGSFFTGVGTGPKEQFYTKAQNRRRLDSDNKKYNKNFYSAGILPFYVKNKTLYVLLGKDADGKWSDFGGRSEGQDRGRWDTTASREFYEETIGSVMDIPTMMSKLHNKKNYIKVKGKTLNGSAYFMYVVRIPYTETYRQYFQNTLSFIKYTKNNSNRSNKASFLEYKYFEKTDIQWVSLDTLKISLETEENSDAVNYPLRHVFKRTLEGHIDRIVDFCSRFYGTNVFNEHRDQLIEINNSDGHYKTLQGFYGSTGSSEAADQWRNLTG